MLLEWCLSSQPFSSRFLDPSALRPSRICCILPLATQFQLLHSEPSALSPAMAPYRNIRSQQRQDGQFPPRKYHSLHCMLLAAVGAIIHLK